MCTVKSIMIDFFAFYFMTSPVPWNEAESNPQST